MFISTKTTQAALIGSLMMALSACGGSDSSSSSGGAVTVSLSNLNTVAARASTPLDSLLSRSVSLLSTQVNPTEFAVRLAQIYLVEDQDISDTDLAAGAVIGNNVGQTGFLWYADDCPKGSDDADCETMEYFDLNRATDLVGTDLNAKEMEVSAGEYKYIKLALLGSQQGGTNTYNNVRWGDTAASPSVASREFASVQTEWAAKFETPLTVAEGDTITVSLIYDLSGIVEESSSRTAKVAGQGTFQPGKADDCSGTTCLDFPALTVSATKK